MSPSKLILAVFGFVFLILLAGCAPAQPEPLPIVEIDSTATPVASHPIFTSTALPTQLVVPTLQPTQVAPLPTQSPPAITTALPTPSFPEIQAPTPEAHAVQVEWPARIRLGESDVVRMILIPASKSYLLVTEYPEHQIITRTVSIQRTSGYELFAVARLDGVGFMISPDREQVQYLPPGEILTWRWSLLPRHPGRQRLAILLTLRWVPSSVDSGITREVTAYSQTLDVQVLSFFGLSKVQAVLTGIVSILLGGGFGLLALVIRPREFRRSEAISVHQPNSRLAIELPAGFILSLPEQSLLQTLFRRYDRLVIEQEFLSGYSGARTFLVLPIRSDGRSDAYTIAKIGERRSILHEFENYENFVKDTLPPITARIQQAPVSSAIPKEHGLAALQYTFIGEPGSTPTSLHRALLSNPDPGLLHKLLETFGPNWWLQRRPYTFRLGMEYDRALPTHFVLEPAAGKGLELDGRTPIPPSALHLQIGDLVTIRNFPSVEIRIDKRSLSLQGSTNVGQPPLRLRWLSTQKPEGSTGRVVATRETLLRKMVLSFDLLDLPDPLLKIPELLDETIKGSQSTIHGDLNLENVLIGPGNMVWLIDFAQTRDGHTLYDFAHLEAEIIAHILAPRINSTGDYLALLGDTPNPEHGSLSMLITTVHEIANRCLSNPLQPREYHLAVLLTCLGALKYSNLNDHSRHLLYLTAAFLSQRLYPLN